MSKQINASDPWLGGENFEQNNYIGILSGKGNFYSPTVEISRSAKAHNIHIDW